MVRRGPVERVAAWVVTGPVGHFCLGFVDWAVLARRYAWARVRGRDPWMGEPHR